MFTWQYRVVLPLLDKPTIRMDLALEVVLVLNQ